MSFNLSATRLKSFQACPYKYQKTYIEKNWEDGSFHTEFGLIMHAVLEQFKRLETKSEIALLDLHRQEFAKPQYQLVNDPQAFERQQRQLKDYWFNESSVAPLEILMLEEKFEGVLSNGVPVVARIDYAAKVDERTIIIKDYKTSMLFPTRWEVEEDIQLSMYNEIIALKFPWVKKIILELVFLNGPTMRTERQPHQRQSFLDFLAAFYERMQQETLFAPRLNQYCHTCQFRAECPAYQQVMLEPVEVMSGGLGKITGKKVAVKEIQLHFPEDLDKTSSFLDMLKKKSKILKQLEEELEKAMANYMEAESQKALETEHYVLSARQKEYRNIDPTVAFEILHPYDQFFKCIRVTKEEVEKFCKELRQTGRKIEAEAIEHELERDLRIYFSKPSIHLEEKVVTKSEVVMKSNGAIPAFVEAELQFQTGVGALQKEATVPEVVPETVPVKKKRGRPAKNPVDTTTKV